MVHGYLSLVIAVVSILISIMGFGILKLANGSLRVTSISNFFFYNYVIFCFIGSCLVNIVLLSYQQSIGFYYRLDLVLNIWYYSAAGLMLMPLGMLIANQLFSYAPIFQSKKFGENNLLLFKEDTSSRMYWVLVLFSVISFMAMIVFMQSLSQVPILSLLKGDVETVVLDQLRSDSGNNYTGDAARMNYIFRTFPLLILSLLYFLRNNGRKWKIFFFIMLSMNIFISVLELHKAPLIQLMLLLVLCYLFERKSIKIKTLIFGSLSIVTLVLTMYIFFTVLGNRSVGDLLWAPFSRIFIGQIWPFYFWQLYQEAYGYMHGATFSNPGGLLPFENIVITSEINDFAFPELASLGIVGSMPTVYFADWFINFGPVAALFSMILFGFLIQVLEIYFVKKLAVKKTLTLSALYIFLMYYFSQFAGTTFTNLIFDVYLMIPLFFCCLVYIVTRIKIKTY